MTSDPPNPRSKTDQDQQEQGIHPGNAGLPFDISFATLATYSVATAVLIQVFGFVITTNYYTRIGVPPASIPQATVWAAGAAFAAITGYYMYLGAAVAWMAKRERTKRDSIEMILYQFTMGVGLYFVLSWFSIRWPGPGIYFVPCALTGWIVGKYGTPPYWFTLSRDRVHLPDLARILLPVLAGLWLFSRAVFPNLARAVGGGAPIPVVVHLSADAAGLIPPGSRTYEVFSDSAFLFLEVKLGDDPAGVQRDDADKSEDIAWEPDPFEIPRTRYVQIPLGAIRSIRRLRLSATPPTYEAAPAAPAPTPGAQLPCPGAPLFGVLGATASPPQDPIPWRAAPAGKGSAQSR